MTPDDAELDLPQELRDGLIAVGEAARDLDQPWWIFGGAAMALYGLTDIHVPDIDVLCAPRDARALLAALGGQIVPDPGEGLFRSAVFGRARGATRPPTGGLAGFGLRAPVPNFFTSPALRGFTTVSAFSKE